MKRTRASSAFAVIVLVSFLANFTIVDRAFSDEDLADDVKVISAEEVTEKGSDEAIKEAFEEPAKKQMEVAVEEPVKEPAKAPAVDPVKEPVQLQLMEPVKEPVKQPMIDPVKEPVNEAVKDVLNVNQPVEGDLNIPSVEIPEKVYQLKRIDPNRIGAESSYVTFGGFRPIDYVMKNPALGVGTRVEIYQEPKPVDAYIIMFKEMQHNYNDFHAYWNPNTQFEKTAFRSIVQPLFVRAYGTEFTLSDPDESSGDIKGQVKYTIDYRDVYREYYPKFPDVKMSRWLQNDIILISMAKIEPLEWNYTSNIGYRYSTVNVKEIDPRWDFTSGDEWRSTYYVNQSLTFNPRFEIFAQGEYFKSQHDRSLWSNEPDHYLAAGELRLKSQDLKTSYTGRFSYSLDIYSPFSNTYEKYEIWARIGRDFNDRLNAYTMLKYAYGHTRSEDNAWWVAPPGVTLPISAPFDITALALTSENRIQYRIYDKLWLQGGLDLGTGINLSNFDNIGWLAGLEYYAPGIIRVDVGWRGNQFYNIDDFLSTIYFKCYLFM